MPPPVRCICILFTLFYVRGQLAFCFPFDSASLPRLSLYSDSWTASESWREGELLSWLPDRNDAYVYDTRVDRTDHVKLCGVGDSSGGLGPGCWNPGRGLLWMRSTSGALRE